jgi:hypothetical protein
VLQVRAGLGAVALRTVGVSVSLTVMLASALVFAVNWMAVVGAVPTQPATGVTENVAVVWGVAAPGAVRVRVALVKATVSPPPGEAGKPTRRVLAPVRAVLRETVIVPAVATPVIELQVAAVDVRCNRAGVTVSVTVEVASLVTPTVNWTTVEATTPAQPVTGVTEKVAVVWGVAAPGAVRVAVALVRATVRPPPGETGKPMVAVLTPVSAVTRDTVMVPGVATPVIWLHDTEAAVAEKVRACAVPARPVNAAIAAIAKSAFDPLVFITDKSMKDRPFLMVFSTKLRGEAARHMAATGFIGSYE